MTHRHLSSSKHPSLAMARIASGVKTCCYRHVPYDVINKRYSALSGRYPAEKAERLNDFVFIDISAFTAYFAFGFFVYCLFLRTEWPYRTKTVFIIIALKLYAFCLNWNQGYHIEHRWCFSSKFTTVYWEEWSNSHFHLRQTKRFQIEHHNLSAPE